MDKYNSVEVYQRDIIEKLLAFQKQGLGKLMEIAETEIDGVKVPFVAFATSNPAGTPGLIVTARHHVFESYATTTAAMHLAGMGVEGLVIVPVIDTANYAKAEYYKQQVLSLPDPLQSLHFQDFLWGYKDLPQKVAIKDWKDYNYIGSGPPYIEGVKKLVENSRGVIDLHNTGHLHGFCFVTRYKSSNLEKAMASIGEHASSMSLPIAEVGKHYVQLHPGFYLQVEGSGTIADFANKSGGYYLAFEIPVFASRHPIKLIDEAATEAIVAELVITAARNI